jgi:hypothetical protein
MTNELNRRTFIGSAAASGAFTIVPRHVLGGTGFVPPSDKITMAHIGMGTQGFNELGGLLSNPELQIVAVCDPNTESNDYVEWGPNSVRNNIRRLMGNATWREGVTGCPGGREIGRQVVNAYYANQRAAENFKGCSAYADFRELLEKEKDINVVKIMTPDHLHTTVSVAAMKKGINVLVHKPLGNRMYEARLAIETARKTGLATHFLPYGSGTSMRALIPKIRAGAIGTLREVHNWTNRPVWPQYLEIPTDRPPVPKGLDWDLWLGPTLDRPYHPHYTHAVFRSWYDFGGGCMADMGIYSLWPVFTGLELGSPLSADPYVTHYCTIVDQVSRKFNNDFSFPTASTVRFKFAARGDMPPLDLFWYDGGMRPRIPAEMEADGKEMPQEGILFVGDEGKIVAAFTGENPQIYPKSRSEYLPPQPASARGGGRGGAGGRGAAGAAGAAGTRGPAAPGGRREAWVDAIKGGPQSPGSFLNAGPISDAVNLYAVALRTGKKVLFDSESMKITNVAEANKYLVREYRKGWEL